MRKWILLLGALVLVFPAASRAAGPRRGRGQPEQTDRLIVKFRDRRLMRAAALSVSDLQPLSALAGLPLAHHRRMSGDAQVLRLPSRMSLDQVEALLQRLRGDASVEFAEADRIRKPYLAPNDPQYPNQWHYFAPASVPGGADLPAAWDITTGSVGSTVAVIDTGWLNHQDLAGRNVPGYCFISDGNMANNAACTPGAPTSDPSDPGDWVTSAEDSNCPNGPFCGCGVSNSSWHGTHVSGTVGAASNNGVGVAGVNWQSKILPVRVLGKCGGYDSDIIDGMYWAAGLASTAYPTLVNLNPAKVLSMSLGGSGSCTAAWQNAINAINAAGATVVVAAGNDGVNLTYNPDIPASCSGVIAVAAVGRNGEKSFYTNYGSAVAIAAPGGDDPAFSNNSQEVLSTLNSGTQGPINVGGSGDTYGYDQGTSMATPHVSGVISLMLSVNPSLTPVQIKQILQSTARPFPTGSGCTTLICGAGLLDAAAAVRAALPAPPSGLAGTALGISSITWTWSNSGVPGYAFYPSTGGPAILLAGTSLIQTGLSTNTAYGAAVASVMGAPGPLSATVTAYTLAAPPTSYALVQVNASSITVSWAANTNPSGTTSYRVDYWQAVGSTYSTVSQGLNATLTNLFGGATYFLTVSALNGAGAVTGSGVLLSTVTLPAAGTNIGASGGTLVTGPATLQIPPGAYGQNVEVSLLTPNSLSGPSFVETLTPTGIGLEVDLNPAIEPSRPVTLTMSYQGANLAGLDPTRFVIASYDTATNAWAPWTSKVDVVNRTVIATVSHLSTFQIMQASPAADVSQFKIGPNPLRPSRGKSQMSFVGPSGAEVRIYTLAGELVKDLSLTANGSGSWDATNKTGQSVASGVYFVFVKSGSQNHSYKVIVER